MSQPNRLGALNKFKSGSRTILLATDVASRWARAPARGGGSHRGDGGRGLDIPTVDVVINYDIPQHSKV